MHIIVRIKQSPDSAQIRIEPMTDSMMRREEGLMSARISRRRRRLDMDCLTGARALSHSMRGGGPKPGRKYRSASGLVSSSGLASSSMEAPRRRRRGGLAAAVTVLVGWKPQAANVRDISRSGPPGRTPIAVRRLLAWPGSTEQLERTIPPTGRPGADQK